MKENQRFKHESLQDTKTISTLLTALTDAISDGKIVMEDDNSLLTMEPKGLLLLKISALKEDDQNRLNIKISWQGETKVESGKNIKISGR
ncbi:MAG: amphi-Trp domain-containing protein [Terasakiella sp.]|uniref:amphi-Trp domain-containing protein n=1 Tax=unclassified Terasakiella TaxID=2614952 RepID=UPI003B009C59